MAAFTTLALIGAGLATAQAIKARKAANAAKPAPQGNLGTGPLAPGPVLGTATNTAAPRGSLIGGGPTPPNASLAASTAAGAALAALTKQKRKAASGDILSAGTPGARTPPAKFDARTLIGY